MGDFLETNRPKIFVSHPLTPKVAVDLLKTKADVTRCDGPLEPSKEEIYSKAKGVDAILWSSHFPINAEALDAIGPQLKVISTMSAGIDYVDIPEVKKRGILLGHTPKVLDDAVADVAIGLMIAAARRFHEGRLSILAEEWVITPQYLLGMDIKSATIGIFGFGNIGQTIVKRLQGFNIGGVLYTGHSPKPEGDKIGAKFVSFDELCEQSDFIFVCSPLTNETREKFNAQAFNNMKSNCVFINVARGPIVDHDALADALKSHKIFAAGLDVMVPEPLPINSHLLDLPNLVVIPHLGSATIRTRDDMALIAAHNILRGLAGVPMLSPV